MGARMTTSLAAVLLIGSAVASLAQDATDNAMRRVDNPAATVKQDGPAVPSAKMEPGAPSQGQTTIREQAPPPPSAKMEPEASPPGSGKDAASGNVGTTGTGAASAK